jgi:hypothetical protein
MYESICAALEYLEDGGRMEQNVARASRVLDLTALTNGGRRFDESATTTTSCRVDARARILELLEKKDILVVHDTNERVLGLDLE